MSIEIRGSSSSGEVTVIASRVLSPSANQLPALNHTDLNDLLKFKRHERHNGERHRPLFQLIGLQHTGKFGWWPPSYRASRHTVLSLSASPIGFSDSLEISVFSASPSPSSQSQWSLRAKLPISDEYSISSAYA